jgi:hypothetical protein
VRHNILNASECQVLREIVDDHAASDDYQEGIEHVNMLRLDAYCTDLDSNRCAPPKNSLPYEKRQLIRRVQHRVLSAVRESFNSSSIFIENGDLTSRGALPQITLSAVLQELYRMAGELYRMGRLENPEVDWGIVEFLAEELQCALNPLAMVGVNRCMGGQSLHVDSCAFDLMTGECHHGPDYCCSWRTHSGILYLGDGGGDDFAGGEFVFVDPHSSRAAGPPSISDVYTRRRKFTPKCGSLVTFKADVSNIHGVAPVTQGVRHAAAFWFTDIAEASVVGAWVCDSRRDYDPDGKLMELCLTDPGEPGPDGDLPQPARRCLELVEGRATFAEFSPDGRKKPRGNFANGPRYPPHPPQDQAG